MSPICVKRLDATMNMTTLDKNRCAKCSMVILEVFPKMMQDLMRHTGFGAKVLYKRILKNDPFRKKLNNSELRMVDTLDTDEYTKIDVSLSYKIIVTFFQLFISPPSRGWNANPKDEEKGIGEDIERIRRERNSFVHRVNAVISEPLFDNFFEKFIIVGERIDAYLKKPADNGYAHDVEQYKTCVLDPDHEKKQLDALVDIEQLKEMCTTAFGNPKKELHIFVGKSTEAAIENIQKGEDESYSKIKIIIHEVDDSDEVVKIINSLKEGHTSDDIKFIGAEKGSILLFIDVKNKVLLDKDLFRGEMVCFLCDLFNCYHLARYFHTQTYAVIASAAEEFDETAINPENFLDEKGSVVLKFEVKNKIFHFPDSLKRTLNGVFKSLVMDNNEKIFLGKTDIYAELVKYEKTLVQAQIPVKCNLPVSANLRQRIHLKSNVPTYQSIDSCIKIGNTLVFAVSHSSQLITCSSYGTDFHYIPLPYIPYYMTEVASNMVAVSGAVNKIVMIINISRCSVTSIINTSGACWGISYDGSNLYVVIDQNIIQIMDLSGRVIRTIPTPSDNTYYITVDRDRFICIDAKSVHCCSLDGKLMWTFKKKEYPDIVGATTDDEGNVYVVNCFTSTVVVVSEDGSLRKEILTEESGLKKPGALHFDKKENVLLVCNIDNWEAFLFDITKKSHK